MDDLPRLRRGGRRHASSPASAAPGAFRPATCRSAAAATSRQTAREWLAEAARETGLAEPRLDALLARYGTTALAIARHEAGSDVGPLPDSADYSQAEIDWIVRNERVVHLADIVMRRTTLAITGALTARDLDAIAAVAADALNWHEERTAAEIMATTAELTRRHRLALG